MLRDVKSNLLFTINELSQDEQEEWLLEQREKMGLTWDAPLSAQDKQDVQLLLQQYRETRRIAFPVGPGVTGLAFEKEETVVGNFGAGKGVGGDHKSKKEMGQLSARKGDIGKFMFDIDNQTSARAVNNFMFGPVFGHPHDTLTREQADHCLQDGDCLSDDSETGQKKLKFENINRQKPLGIIQFINKEGQEPITRYDKEKFEAL